MKNYIYLSLLSFILLTYAPQGFSAEDEHHEGHPPAGRVADYEPGDPNVFLNPEAFDESKRTVSLGYRILHFFGLA